MKKSILSMHCNFKTPYLKRLTVIVAFLFSVLSSYAFEIISQEVSINSKNIPLNKIFSEIEKQTGYLFVYNNQIDVNRKVTVNVKNQKVAQVLDVLFKDTNISYAIQDAHIVLSLKQNEKISAVQQEKTTVKGQVVDEDGMPVSGATVSVKGSSETAQTDLEGNFSIEVAEGATLVISFTGKETMEVVAGAVFLNVTLKNGDNVELEEVVVVGYTTQKKADLTGAVSSIKMADIQNQSTSGIASAIQGRASGVTVMQNGGAPGASVSIRIRGTGTLGNSEPLYIIDGMPADNMNDLNPNDIERLDILKDAASAAIYGSRAANGVVIIQTKKGSNKERNVISFNSYYGIASPINKIELLNAEQRNMIHTEAYVNDGKKVPDYYTSDYAKVTRTDWQDEIFKTKAIQKNYDFGISGASNKARYNLAFGNLSQEGILKNSGYDRTTFRINSEMNFFKNLKIGENLMLTKSDQSLVDDAGVFGAVYSAMKYDPSVPVFEESGAYSGSGALGTDLKNPVSIVDRSDNHIRRKRVFGDLYLEFSFLNDFVFKTDFGYDMSVNNQKIFYMKVPEAGKPQNTNELYESYNESVRFMNTTTVKYDKTFGANHVMVLGGTSYEDYSELYGSTSVGGFISENPEQRYASAGTTMNYIKGGRTEWALQSFFSRLDYDFAGKYLMSFSYRADGSSKFSKDNRWGYFPSISAGWRISEESFFQNLKGAVQNLKLRTSWGKLGNQNIYSNYPTKTLIANTTEPYGNRVVFGSSENSTFGRYEASIPNSNLRWEVTTQYDLGFDVTFLKNFELGFDYFTKKTSDILLQIPIPSLPGVGEKPWVNAADMNNTGYELNLNYRTKIDKLDIRVYGNFSHVTNEVVSLGRGTAFTEGAYKISGNTTSRTSAGYPKTYYYGYKTGGLFKSQQEVDSYVNSSGSKLQPDAKVGDLKFLDLNGDGKLDDTNDRTYLGDGFPDFSYGFGTELGYKGIDFSFFFQGVAGREIFNAQKQEGVFVNPIYNQFSDILDRYNPVTNPNGTIPSLTNDDKNNNKRFSDFYVEDGSYLRLKNITLGYSFDKDLLKKIKLDKLRFYVSGQNYLTFTKYKGLDPENDVNGVDVGQFPQSKTFLMGLNVNF